MRSRKAFFTALTLMIAVGLVAAYAEAAPAAQGRKQEVKPPAPKGGLPKEIAAVIQEGLATRQGRQDIPLSFFKQIILPAQGNNLYPVFFFKAKNGDLGYAPSATGAGEMEASINVFTQFFQTEENGATRPVYSTKALAVLKTPAEGYSAEKEDWYSLALALPPSKYTLALVLATPDMKKMSVAYTDVTLPGQQTIETTLLPSDPVIVTAVEQVTPDDRVTIHRGRFNWGGLQVAANMGGEIASGQDLDILFFIIGAAPKDPTAARPTNDIEVNYEVRNTAGQPAIRWSPQTYESFYVSQQLPLVQTLQTSDEKGNVISTRKQPLAAGKYELFCQITDKVSGKKAEVKVPFEVK